MSPLKLLLLAGASSIVTAFSTALSNPNATAVSVSPVPEGESLPVGEVVVPPPMMGCPECLGAIVALGQLAWTVATNGAASGQLAGKYFGAAPTNWMEATGWREDYPPSANIRYNMMNGWDGGRNLLSWKNAFGFDICAVRTNLRRQYGGNINGVGSFLNNVHVELDYIDDIFGTGINVEVEYANPSNVGTTANPVAKTSMKLKVHCDNMLQDLRRDCEWDIYGDGRVRYKGCRDPTGGRRLDEPKSSAPAA